MATDRATGGRGGRFPARLPGIAVVLLAGLALRLILAEIVLPGQGLSEDLRSFNRWALTLADFGPGGFFANAGFADLPPGYLYLLWPLGVLGRLLGGLTGIPAEQVVGSLVKLPAILADVALGYLLYRSVRSWSGARAGIAAAALYLLIPFTWYDSAVFGQMDSVGMVVVLGALLLLIGGWSEAAVGLTVLAIVIKPQYAITLAVVGPVLLRRHLFRSGSGPIPSPSGRVGRLDRALGGWLTRRQGPERLGSSALVGVVALVVPLLPFDIGLLAPPDLAGVPVVGNVAGFAALTSSLAGYYHVLTADAFNAWALVGHIPLSHELSRDFTWLFDSLEVIGPFSAFTVGATLLAAAAALVAVVLVRRDDRTAILVGFTVIAFAFFALPTRVHERYQFPIFVTGAILAATSVRWRWWYAALGLLGTVNLHAIVTLARPGFATPGLVGAPLGDLFRSDAVVVAVSIAHTALFAGLLAVWVRDFVWRAIRTVRWGQARAARRPVTRWRAARAADSESTLAQRGFRAAPASDAVPSSPAVVASPRTVRPPSPERADPLAGEGRGRLDRRAVEIALLVVLVTFGMRMIRIDQPRTMYFDELYYPSTAAEFLRDWRYGITTNIFEWTHPHVAKYIQAVSIVALGNDRVVATANVGAPVRDAAFEPAFAQSGGGFGGDRIAVATGTDVRVSLHGALESATLVPLAGASAVAFDRETERLYIGTDHGGIWTLAGASAVPLGTIDGPVQHLTVVARDRLAARTAGDRLVLVDGSTGATLGSAILPGLRGLVRVPVGDHSVVVASVPMGLVELDTAALAKIGEFPLVAPPAGLDFVDGSDYGWRNQDTLPEPRLYVALEGNQLVALRVETDGKLTVVDTFPMPGPVTDVRWDRPTNMVYALGRTSTNQPTLYVVEPHTDSVFADAVLPFEPTTWLLDVQPNTPSMDRQRALAFSGDGAVAIVDTGGHAVAWRLPGVVSGALTMGLLYLLTRMLFRRRLVADLLAVCLALDGLLFSQGRLGTSDSIMGFFIIAAITLLAYLLMGRNGSHDRESPRGWSARGGRGLRGRAALRSGGEGRRRIGTALGLLGVGILLGLALATKWVGAYAIGACVLLVLAQTPVGRRLALTGLLLVTSVLGYQAIAGNPPNVLFLLLMVGVTVAAGVAILRPYPMPNDWGADGGGDGSEDGDVDDDRDVVHEADGAPVDLSLPEFADPRRRFGIPFGLAVACLTLVPLGVYVLTYVPWALSASGGPQLFPGWPPGHTGQTFLDLQGQMYAYHADLRTPHGNGSPWWAWPFGLRPFWGYYDTYSDGSQALMLMAGNPVLVWLSVPAIAFGIWQAWQRRTPGLAFVLIAFLSLWLPWARIDRVAYNYHYYTPIMFAFVLLAYFLAELWGGPSRRAWNLARASFALVLVAPALLWIFKDPLCVLAGANQVDPNSFECNRPLSDVAVPIAAWLLGSIPLAWLVLRMREPRRLVAWVIGAAVVAFVVLYPALSALPIPNGWALVYQGLLPTWEVSFHFISNTAPAVAVPLLGPGPIGVLLATGALLWGVLRLRDHGFGPFVVAESPDRGVGRQDARGAGLEALSADRAAAADRAEVQPAWAEPAAVGLAATEAPMTGPIGQRPVQAESGQTSERGDAGWSVEAVWTTLAGWIHSAAPRRLDERRGALLGLAVFGLLLLSGPGFLPSPARIFLLLAWPVVAVLAARVAPGPLVAAYTVAGGALLRLADFHGGGRASDVLTLVDQAISVGLSGSNPYDHAYLGGEGTPLVYPPFQLLLHLPGHVLAGFDGVGFTEVIGAIAVLALLAGLAWRLSWTAGLPVVAAYAALPNLINLTNDGSNDTSAGALVLLAIVAVAWAGSARWDPRILTVAGLIAGAALGTKQTALFVVVLLVVYVWHAAGRRSAVQYLTAAAGLLAVISIPFLVLGPGRYLTDLSAFAGFHEDIFGWNMWVAAQALGWPVLDVTAATVLNLAISLVALAGAAVVRYRTLSSAVVAGVVVTMVALLTARWTTYAYFAMVAPVLLAAPALMSLRETSREATREPEDMADGRLPRSRRRRALGGGAFPRRGLPGGAFRAAIAARLSAIGGDPATVVDRYGVPVGLFIVAWIVYTIVNHGRATGLDYFVPLAEAFLHGRLGLDASFSWLNEVIPGKEGLFYVVYPPAPAVLLMPSVWLLGPGLEQARSSILLGAVNVALVSVVIREMGVARRMRIMLSLVFAFGTIVWFSAQLGSAWHFAHVVATFFMLLAILACQRDARTWLIGLLFAGAVLSRLPVLLAGPFFLAYLVDRAIRSTTGDRTPFGAIESGRVARGATRGFDFLPGALAAWRERRDLRRLATLAIPMAVALAIPLLYYLAYNALRFGSPFENGYALIPGLLQEPAFSDGVFSIAYIPRQLNVLLLSLPQFVPDFPFVKPLLLGGPTILLTSPILLWAFKSRRLDLFNIGAWAAVILVLIPDLTHATTGDEQFGYRFAQDAYPFLFLLTVRALRGRISGLAWDAIAVGFVVNLWGMVAAYFAWWA